MTLEKENQAEAETRNQWLRELSEFIVEANLATWAGDGKEVEPETPDYKELEYARGNWSLRDRYTGYFRAPGMTTVRYKGKPAWTMQYGGRGMTEGHEEKAKPTYEFLKKTLQRVSPDLPFRGPKEYLEGNRRYAFQLLHGDITDALWKEEITENGILTFTQTGLAGLVIHRDQDKKPLLPWKL